MHFLIFSYSPSFPNKMRASKAKTQKIEPDPNLFWWTKVSDSLCNDLQFAVALKLQFFQSQSAALLFVHTLIFPHLSYCITTWTQACVTTLKPVYSFYKQMLKVLDIKPRDYHYCTILKKLHLVILIILYFTVMYVWCIKWSISLLPLLLGDAWPITAVPVGQEHLLGEI